MSATSYVLSALRAPDANHLGRHHRLALLAMAAQTVEDLDSPNGYTYVTAARIARITGLAESTVRGILRDLSARGYLVMVADFAAVQHVYTGQKAQRLPRGARIRGFRLVEDALQ